MSGLNKVVAIGVSAIVMGAIAMQPALAGDGITLHNGYWSPEYQVDMSYSVPHGTRGLRAIEVKYHGRWTAFAITVDAKYRMFSASDVAPDSGDVGAVNALPKKAQVRVAQCEMSEYEYYSIHPFYFRDPENGKLLRYYGQQDYCGARGVASLEKVYPAKWRYSNVATVYYGKRRYRDNLPWVEAKGLRPGSRVLRLTTPLPSGDYVKVKQVGGKAVNLRLHKGTTTKVRLNHRIGRKAHRLVMSHLLGTEWKYRL